jgi:hypothetical protein
MWLKVIAALQLFAFCETRNWHPYVCHVYKNLLIVRSSYRTTCQRFGLKKEMKYSITLVFRHITGVKEWDPLAKARYLRQLWDRTPGDNAERLRILARKIGSQPYYVKRLLGGLRIFDTIERSGFYSIEGLDDNSLSFSLLSTALSFDSLNEFLGVPDDPTEDAQLHEENVEKLARWAFEQQPGGSGTVLGDSRNMQKLAAVVERPHALDLLGRARRWTTLCSLQSTWVSNSRATSGRRGIDLMRLNACCGG